MAEYVGLGRIEGRDEFLRGRTRLAMTTARGKALSDPRFVVRSVARAHSMPGSGSCLRPGTLSNWLARGIRGYGLAG